MRARLVTAIERFRFRDSRTFWEHNYAAGGNSGPGSYGEMADFKARVLNDFVTANGVQSVIEFGCGDGNQLSLARYPTYVGLDISPSAIRLCIDQFAEDSTKSFFAYDWQAWHDPLRVIRADLALSLDVLFHVVEDDAYDAYLRHLFAAANLHVIIYSINDDRPFPEPYSKPRRFTDWVETHQPTWRLDGVIPNEYPVGDGGGSWSDFYVFGRA
jgi:cyclopropane fatty-acyl-phospholipid synthase-like methyltransferase